MECSIRAVALLVSEGGMRRAAGYGGGDVLHLLITRHGLLAQKALSLEFLPTNPFKQSSSVDGITKSLNWSEQVGEGRGCV